MKMFKKMMACVLSAAFVMGMSLAVSAEVPSVIKDNNAVTNVTADNGSSFTWVDLQGDTLKTLPSQVVNAIQTANASETDPIVNTVEKFVKAADDPTITAAFSDGKDWVWRSTFGDLVATTPGESANGRVNVTFTVPGIGSIANEVKVVHYDAEKGWQILKVVSVNGDKVTVEFENFSPTAIAVVLKKAQAPASAPSQNASGNTTAKTAQTTVARSAAPAGTVSPKTGVSTGWMGFAAAAMMLTVCGISMSRKKKA